MPVTFTALGANLEINVIDDNLKIWQDVFRAGLLAADFLDNISRFRVFRYTSGKLVSAHSFANPYRDTTARNTMGLIDIFDLTYRRAVENEGLVANASAREGVGPRNAYAMEMLGKPGPTFYYQWQEDGLNPTLVAAAAGSGGWPPTDWPYSRYPEGYCFSRWLTVPGASLRINVPDKAVARITAHVKGNFDHWSKISPAGAALAASGAQRQDHRDERMLRAGLIVDHNPREPSAQQEFANSNVNIVDPISGATASHVSWKVVNDQSFMHAQREVIRLTGEVALKGNCDYNFNLKIRESGHHGWVNQGSDVWQDDVWEWNGTAAGTVTDNRVQTNYASAPAAKVIPRALFHRLYESSSIDVELFYGRSTAYINDVANSEFS